MNTETSPGINDNSGALNARPTRDVTRKRGI